MVKAGKPKEGEMKNTSHAEMRTEAEYSADAVAKQITGYRITNTLVSDDKESWGFRIVSPRGKVKVVWVDRDPEGNGPGHLDVEDWKK